MDQNPPAIAGDVGFDPWSRKIPHAMEQLKAHEPQVLSLRAASLST